MVNYITLAIDNGKKYMWMENGKSTSARIKEWIRDNSITDILVLVHGWMTDSVEADENYKSFIRNFESEINEFPISINIGIINVTWPSKMFGEKQNYIRRALNFAIPRKHQNTVGFSGFGIVTSTQSVELPPNMTPREKLLLDNLEQRRTRRGKKSSLIKWAKDTGYELGYNFGNVFTFHKIESQAKKDIAKCLSKALNSVIEEGKRIHMIGHSFGALAVCAAAKKLAEVGELASITLLQAAIPASCFGSKGLFHRLIERNKVSGPIVITHTKNDFCLRFVYPLINRFSSCIGENGAIDIKKDKLSSRNLSMSVRDTSFKFELDGKVHNVNADEVIYGHCDVWKNALVASLARSVVKSASTAMWVGLIDKQKVFVVV